MFRPNKRFRNLLLKGLLRQIKRVGGFVFAESHLLLIPNLIYLSFGKTLKQRFISISRDRIIRKQSCRSRSTLKIVRLQSIFPLIFP